jgi:sugar phosphate isomerase/epimerase
MSRYGDRVFAYHIKDLAPAGEKLDEDGWADVGTGIVDFAAYLPALYAAPVKLWIAEHDNPSDDARFARAAYDAMSSWSKPQ